MTLAPVVHAFGLARTAADASEDAYAVDVTSARFALADGASSAWRAGDWAATLVASWVTTARPRARSGGEAEAFARWLEGARATFAPEGVAPADQAWFATAAAERGAHATFVGLELTGLGGRRPRLRAFAVGDSCLLLVRADRLELATPLDDPAAFGSHPQLVSSLPGTPAPVPVVTGTAVQADDLLLLASDALAAFLLRLAAGGDGAADTDGVWRALRRLDTAGFARLAGEGIASGLLERDDLTLVRIVLAPAPTAAPGGPTTPGGSA